MKQFLVFALASFISLPTLAATTPNLYECVGDGMYTRLNYLSCA